MKKNTNPVVPSPWELDPTDVDMPTQRPLTAKTQTKAEVIAKAAPAIITGTPSSPPIASMAIRGFIDTSYSPVKGLGDCHHFAAIIMTTSIAQMVRTLQFTTIGAFLIRSNFERIMAAAHAALRRRCFSFGDSHFGTCSISKSISSKPC
jgi:hypothetical protein